MRDYGAIFLANNLMTIATAKFTLMSVLVAYVTFYLVIIPAIRLNMIKFSTVIAAHPMFPISSCYNIVFLTIIGS